MSKTPQHLLQTAAPKFSHKPLRSTLLSCRLVIAGLLMSGQAWADPALQTDSILVSIKPVALIVKALVPENEQIKILLPASASPHDYHLKPSDIRSLRATESIVWVGPEMEPYLTKALRTHQTADNILQLHTQTESLNTEAKHNPEDHQLTHGDGDEDQQSHNHEGHDGHDGHEHQGEDPHIWLSPDKAKVMAAQISHWLSSKKPAQKTIYDQKLAQFLQRLETTDTEINKLLEPVRGYGYVVFHDAYSGFEEHYALNHLNALTLNPEQTPSARRLAEVRRQLSNSQARCLFTEPQFNSASIKAVIQGLNIQHATLDPMATNINIADDSYFIFLKDLATRFHECLSLNPD